MAGTVGEAVDRLQGLEVVPKARERQRNWSMQSKTPIDDLGILSSILGFDGSMAGLKVASRQHGIHP